MTSKKRKAAPEEPFKEAILKTDAQFIADYLKSKWIPEWTHPTSGDRYNLHLVQAPELSASDMIACFELIKETSHKDYEASTKGWRPNEKKAEMKSPELRYVLVKDNKSGSVRGFTSLMPTFEEGQPVVYCYEVHLKPELQG